MSFRFALAAVALATSVSFADSAAAQSAAGAPVATGKTRAYGRPFAGNFAAIASRDTPFEKNFGGIYAVLDYKGKIGINGTFEGLSSPAVAAHLHKGADGKRGPKVMDMTVSRATRGVVKGDITLDAAAIEDLERGLYYIEIVTESAPDGEVRGWLLKGFLK